MHYLERIRKRKHLPFAYPHCLSERTYDAACFECGTFLDRECIPEMRAEDEPDIFVYLVKDGLELRSITFPSGKVLDIIHPVFCSMCYYLQRLPPYDPHINTKTDYFPSTRRIESWKIKGKARVMTSWEKWYLGIKPEAGRRRALPSPDDDAFILEKFEPDPAFLMSFLGELNPPITPYSPAKPCSLVAIQQSLDSTRVPRLLEAHSNDYNGVNSNFKGQLVERIVSELGRGPIGSGTLT
ncbi:MAG: hypothetical protein LQ340_005898 [Diploschistes diacapsis]|nr:MAG: hypothetical protein LQ340_005898 [Diploschistes diacapsis]